MSSKVYFSHGKIIDGFFCDYCDMRRKARVIRDRWYWRLHFVCGHVRANAGFVQPFEELERKGYINSDGTPDPRYLAKSKEAWLAFIERKKHLDAQNIDDLFPSKILR